MTEFWGQAGKDLALAIKEQARETLMGPIESILRESGRDMAHHYRVFEAMPLAVREVVWEAARDMKLPFNYWSKVSTNEEVLSAAIEAADRLGL
jgi:hypothetical protein